MKIFILNIILIIACDVKAQYVCELKDNRESLNDCQVSYDTIYQLQNKAYDILNRKDISLSKRIRLSQEYAREGLELGYTAIQQGLCKQYSIIIDRMLTLSNILGKDDEGKVLASTRLDVLYPGWKEYGNEVCIDIEHLRDLISYTYKSGDKSFYDVVRENDGVLGVCGLEDIDYLNEVRKLKNQFGDIYCFRYFQNSFNDINPETPKSYWAEFFDFIIECWTNYIPIDELLTKYENSEIQATDFKFYRLWKPRHFIEIDNTKLYFVPTIKNRYKPAEKENLIFPDPEITKDTSLFYARLKWMAGKD